MVQPDRTLHAFSLKPYSFFLVKLSIEAFYFWILSKCSSRSTPVFAQIIVVISPITLRPVNLQSPRCRTQGGKGKNFFPAQTIKWINGWTEEEHGNISYSKSSEILMVESSWRDIWVLTQNSFNCALCLEISTIRCPDKLKGRKEKVLADCDFVLKKTEADSTKTHFRNPTLLIKDKGA